MDKLMTAAETAEALRVSEGVLRVWRHRRQGPSFIKVGKACMYRREDVEAWLQEQTVTIGSEA